MSDREPNFTAKLFRSFCREFNIELRLTTSYNPASNGEQLIDKTERLFLLLRLSRRSMLRISSVHSLINIRITVLHSTWERSKHVYQPILRGDSRAGPIKPSPLLYALVLSGTNCYALIFLLFPTTKQNIKMF